MGSLNRANLPAGPVTLSIEQIEALCRQLSDLRHDVNNDLSKIVGTAELMKLELMKLSASDPSRPVPKALDRMPTLVDQPKRISQMIEAFSREMEKTLGVSRP
jgi:nitrogen-specific signal transduction histidine kinase